MSRKRKIDAQARLADYHRRLQEAIEKERAENRQNAARDRVRRQVKPAQRIFDLINEDIVIGKPIWASRIEPDKLKAFAESIADGLKDTTIFTYDKVAEYFYRSVEHTVWDMVNDFDCIMPPYDKMWLEANRPEYYGPDRVPFSDYFPTRWGMFVERIAPADFPEQGGASDKIPDLKDTPGCKSIIAFSLVYMQKARVHSFLDFDGNPISKSDLDLRISDGESSFVPIPSFLYVAVDGQGKPLVLPTMILPGGYTEPQYETAMKEDGLRYLQLFMSGFLALSFINCKNIITSEVEPDAEQNRLRRRAGMRPLLRHRTIQIEPVRKVIRRQGREDDREAIKRGLHICGAHFRTYTEDNKLFGKITGRFFIPQHVRGDIGEGIIASRYEINPPKDK